MVEFIETTTFSVMVISTGSMTTAFYTFGTTAFYFIDKLLSCLEMIFPDFFSGGKTTSSLFVPFLIPFCLSRKLSPMTVSIQFMFSQKKYLSSRLSTESSLFYMQYPCQVRIFNYSKRFLTKYF